jgi:hypothetical protein
MSASDAGWMLAGAALLWCGLGVVSWAMALKFARRWVAGSVDAFGLALVLGPFALATTFELLGRERERRGLQHTGDAP